MLKEKIYSELKKKDVALLVVKTRMETRYSLNIAVQLSHKKKEQSEYFKITRIPIIEENRDGPSNTNTRCHHRSLQCHFITRARKRAG